MDQLQAILANYHKLCSYCDLIWKRVREAYPNEIACRKGCGTCCELQSVNQLEAHVIASYIKNCHNGGNDFSTHAKPPSGKSGAGPCPFLHDSGQTCSIYPARPTICRTHGLILRSTEFSQSRAQAASCPYNFPSFHPNDFPVELTIDIDNITKNLTNLNLAFCMLNGIDIGGGELDRVMLADIRLGG
jgi:hypothetical protein